MDANSFKNVTKEADENTLHVVLFVLQVFYAAFLILFTYMMLSNFHPENVGEYSPVEIIVSVWVITLFIEELRQVNILHLSL